MFPSWVSELHSFLRTYVLVFLCQSRKSSLIQRAGVGKSLTGGEPGSLSPLFSFRSGSALAQLYGTSATLEHHHFNHAVMILQSEVQTEYSASLLDRKPIKNVCYLFLCSDRGRDREGGHFF